MRGAAAAGIGLLAAGCNRGILDPVGPVGQAEKQILINSTAIMLAIIIPTMIATVAFAWWFRRGNTKAVYRPDWEYSGAIELVVWSIPALTVLLLGGIAWIGSHDLEPSKPLKSAVKPIEVEVVSLDWKWLFIYPELNIASVNQLAFPANTPVNFKITSDAAMNSFFIPQLGGQIYSMAGMQTKLHLIANEPGSYDGMSANYSGAGFSGMKFKAIATASPAEFDAWVKQVRSGKPLDPTSYAQLLNPSENNPVQHFSSVPPGLFYGVLNKYMAGHQTAMEAGLSPIQLAALTKSLCKTPVVKE